ncbi:MAG TPA: WbqC family protein [bacterium]|nr:WbqC family protein [bacterium]
MIISVHQPQYLPWLGYFDKIDSSDIFVILDNVQFKKREFQNRNRIKTPNGPKWLTVPVKVKGRYHQLAKDVLIDIESGWHTRHAKALELNYRKSVFFENHFEKIAGFLQEGKFGRLADLNISMLRYFLGTLGIDTPILIESDLGVTGTGTERIINICKKAGADTYLSGAGGKNYMREEMFAEAGINLDYQEFAHPEYEQLFGSFMPFMSIADLLFNEGEKSLEIIRKGRKAQ